MFSVDFLHSHFKNLRDIRELKTGGQKIVYDAFHKTFNDVVLKIVINAGGEARILREIAIVKENNFPNVPVIFEYGEIEINNKSVIYIIEQKITGIDLRNKLQSQHEFELLDVLRFIDSLLNTVVKLEEQGIVHRDIKPDNILCDDHGEFWLIDFGIARDLNDVSLTATNANFGPHSPGYAAPEQFRNMKRQIDSRADLFSIGVVAYEMLNGENPFIKGARGVIDVLLKSETLVEDPLVIAGDIHGDLSGFIQTLMQKNHTYRPPSAKIAQAWFKEVSTAIKKEIQ